MGLSWLVLVPALVTAQSQLSSLPGFQQWELQQSRHAASEGRQLNSFSAAPQQQAQQIQSISWQDQINKVKEAEDRLRQHSGQEEALRAQAPVFNPPVQPKIFSEELQKESSESSKVSDSKKAQATLIPNTGEDEPTGDSLVSLAIKNILGKNKKKKENLSSPELNFENDLRVKTSSTGQSFLDKLIEVLAPKNAIEDTNDFEPVEKERSIFDFLDVDSDYSLDSRNNFDSRESEEFGLGEFSSNLYEDDTSIYDFLFDQSNEIPETLEEEDYGEYDFDEEDFAKILFKGQSGAIQDYEEDLEKSFMEKEIAETQSEAEIIADQLALVLVELESDQKAEEEFLKDTYSTIRSKLQSSSTARLVEDEDFINSVFYRFAVMKLPLRAVDIPVSELAEIRRVVKSNLSGVMEDTRALLRELRKDIIQGDSIGQRERADRIDQAKRQLQRLLDIIGSRS